MQFNGKKLDILMKLYISKYKSSKNHNTISGFANEFGYLPSGPDVRGLFEYLIHENCITESGKTWNDAKLYYINEKELKKLLDSQDIIKLAYKCFMYEIP